MASSPPAPFPASLPNPKKRQSMSSQVSAASKRPKLHPLRQTSFPASGADLALASTAASARSETGSIANSTFSALSTTKAPPRGRGRPRKSLQVTDTAANTVRESGSTTGGGKTSKAKSVVSAARSGAGKEDEENEEDEEEEFEDYEDDEHKDIDEKRREDERVQIFLRQLTDVQASRYNYYRSAKLKSNVLRRIINQTVSQSVANNQVEAAQFFAKAFAIEIIERAREVQIENANAATTTIELEKQRKKQKVEKKERELAEKEQAARDTAPPTQLTEQERRAFNLEIKKLKDEANKYIPNKHKGGLLPDHLREALRRYKTDGEGGGVGFDGLSHPLLGVHGSNAWKVGDGASGQRLFR